MKTINYYMKLPYKIELIPDSVEGGFVASYPELPGCLTCGQTVEEAYENALKAKEEWILSALEEKIDIPEPENTQNYSGQFKLRIPKSLHRLLAEHSKLEGISMNQYCLYLLSKNDAVHSTSK